ncbi:MAG: SDR family oxidoreductase [Flavobacteriales bacterium]|nr:SDR family oxidoreductase [Flavobacteriales bacterium]
MNVVITGASRGIGFETCKAFLKNGDTVFAIARSKKKLEELTKFKQNGYLYIIVADLSVDDGLKKCIKEIKSNSNYVDVLINNAGYLVHKSFETTTQEDFQKSIAVNLHVPYFFTQGILPLFEGSKFPQIINIGSMGGYAGSSKFPGLSIYSTSKGALATLTECLAEELKGKNIKVNCLALGAVQTEMLEQAFPGYEAPIQSIEMASFIFDFAMQSSKFINGKIIPVSLNTP